MGLPLISVIIPVYKVEKYLEHCVWSVRKQTYQNLEIILIDDGSPDECPQMCDRYAGLDKRIKVIHKVNEGISSARNAGLDICKGEYISFVDSDDYVHPQFIEKLYLTIKKYNVDVAQCGFKSTFYNIKSLDKHFNITKGRSYVITGKKAADYIVTDNFFSYSVTWNKLFSAKILLGIRYPIDMSNAEDMSLCNRIFFSTSRIAICTDQLYYYYKRPNSFTHARGACLADNVIRVIDEYEQKCRNCMDNADELENCLRLARLRKMDAVTEDYWNAHRSRDFERLLKTKSEYQAMHLNIKKGRDNLKLKFRLFDIHPMLFIAARYVYVIIDFLK